MKYYLYVSKTKIEMLHPQIPATFLRGVEADLKINLGVLSASMKGSSTTSAGDITGKVEVVCRYLLKHADVGTLASPKGYISGTLPLRYGILTPYASDSDIAFFGNEVEGKTLCLVGASDSLLGRVQRAASNHEPVSYTVGLLKQISEAGMPTAEESDYHSYKVAARIALKVVPRKVHQLEFFAKVLHTGPELVIATPLFVAMAD